MKDIEIKDKIVKVNLNKDFYSKKALIVASDAFSESFFVNININSGYYTVLLKPKIDVDLKNIGYEFFNYVLGIIQNE
jgi:hypothetical protein